MAIWAKPLSSVHKTERCKQFIPWAECPEQKSASFQLRKSEWFNTKKKLLFGQQSLGETYQCISMNDTEHAKMLAILLLKKK